MARGGPFGGDAFTVPQPCRINPVEALSAMANPADILPGLQNLPPLSIPNITSLANTLSTVSPQTINSIAASMQNLPPERSSSRNSYSPAMSDSGISMDAASNSSNNNGGMVNFATLSKMGSINFNAQGRFTDVVILIA